MTYLCFEYIWTDADNDLRSKTKILRATFHPEVAKYFYNKPQELQCILLRYLPEWNFDGSSTGQAEGNKSDVILKPAFVCKDPFRLCDEKQYHKFYSFLVLCDTYLPDGTPHTTNKRVACQELAEKVQDQEPLFGIEQEYIVYDNNTNLPVGWLDMDTPSEKYKGQGKYYCSVGADKNFIREIMETHMKYCIYAGLHIRGINAEVCPSQGEYQLGELDAVSIGDELWISRYILNRVCESKNYYVNYRPKPMENWNGSGAHTNFSTKVMREKGGIEHIIEACKKIGNKHNEHIAVYGNPEENKLRLTGHHETAKIDEFRYGVSDRGASIRIPDNVNKNKCGYLEIRSPPANMEPYVVAKRIIQTICME